MKFPKIVLLIALGAGGAYGVYAAVSAGFKHDPCTLDKGGTASTSANYRTLGTADDSAVGLASSGNYRSYAGFVYALPGPDTEWLRIVKTPDPAVLGRNGKTSFTWVSDYDGAYEMLLNGGLIKSGNCSAGVPVTETLQELELDDNMSNTVHVSVDTGTKQMSITVGVVDDQTAPEFAKLEFTQVTGRITDTQRVAEVTVNGVKASISGDTFSCAVYPGTTEIVIETKDAQGKTIGRKKVVRIK